MEKNSKVKTTSFIFAVGRRKEAVARVRLYPAAKKEITIAGQNLKKGDLIVNGKSIEKYFSGEVARVFYLKPFEVTNTRGKFITSVKVAGGGLSGQLGAVVHGVSRALEKYNPDNRPLLKKEGFLTRDSRTRQRRMVGMGGKSRRKKQSPKR